MPIMLAIGSTAGKAVIGSVIGNFVGGLFGRKKQKAANAQAAAQAKAQAEAQAQAEAARRQQMAMAEREQDWRFNTLAPQLQAEQARLSAVSDRLGGQQSRLANLNSRMANSLGSRIQNTWMPLEDQIVNEARYAGGESDQQFAANRASADIRQAISLNEGSQMRMGRAYGGDVNKLAMQQANSSPMNALAEATGIGRARMAAQELGFGKRMQAAKLGDRAYSGFADSSRSAIAAGDNAMKMYTAPSQFALDSGRVVSGAGGNAVSLYNSASSTASGMYNSAANTAANMFDSNARRLSQSDSDFGRYWGMASRDADWSKLWGGGGGGGRALDTFDYGSQMGATYPNSI
jgi:hypothetical protein